MNNQDTTLNVVRIEGIFKECLSLEGEDTKDHVVVNSYILHRQKVSFHPGRLSRHIAEISNMLQDLYGVFKKSCGGKGASYILAVWDKNDCLWTTSYECIEKLFQLGLATGKLQCIEVRVSSKVVPVGLPRFIMD